MSGFAALMALSASQTKESQSAVQSALVQRQRKEELKRKQQEERERKERDLETKLRLKHFEDEKRELERQQRKEREREASELARQRREEEQRDALRYGPKKAKAASSEGSTKWPTSSSQSQAREEVRKKRFPEDDDDDDSTGGVALTREEKRERKLQNEMRRTFQSSKRSTQTGGYLKAGRRLPGGAVDVTTTLQSADPGSTTQSVKERITAMPNTLTKLNTVKRDTRTIDEILQDRAKARDTKVLDGDEAREFNDWFGTKKKEPVKKVAAVSRPPTSTPSSGANTPASQGSGFGSTPVPSSMSKSSASKPTIQKSGSKSTTPLRAATTPISRSGPSDRHALSKPPLPAAKISKSSSASAANSAVNGRSAPLAKKRPRSTSRSESPPPLKKRTLSPADDYKTEIWKLFGKDRGSYVQRDVYSDDEDMEADARVLEREEKVSARIAKKEEEAAAEAERRHEEEKRRKRKEKEQRERRG